MEIKIRHAGDIRHWEDIPVTMRTRELVAHEAYTLLQELKEFCQSKFVTAIRWNENGNLQGHYFENQSIYAEGNNWSFFRWIDSID